MTIHLFVDTREESAKDRMLGERRGEEKNQR
jgi:hypothetical protein